MESSPEQRQPSVAAAVQMPVLSIYNEAVMI